LEIEKGKEVVSDGLLHRCNQRIGHYFLLVAVSAALFLVNLGGASLWDVDEGRNSTAAAEILASGNWITPTFNGVLRVDKPALLYWLQVGAYRLFGINEFAARLPSALAALATVLLCYELGRLLFSPGTGVLAALVVASTPMFCAAARFANPDALLNFTTVLTLYFFRAGYPRQEGGQPARGRWFWFVSMGISMGLGVLAKGPVGMVLPLAITCLVLFWNRQLRLFVNPGFLLGIVVFCLVALPWYVFVAIETKGEFLRGFLMEHNFGRALHTMENHSGSIFYYPIVLMVGFAPWSFFFGLAGWYAGWSLICRPRGSWKGPWERAVDRPDADPAGTDPRPQERTLQAVEPYRLLFCWIIVYLGAFSVVATKLPNYILPVYVPTALLIGRFLDRWRSGAVRPPAWALHITLGGIALAGLAVVFGLLLAGGFIRFNFMNDHYLGGMQKWAALGFVPFAGAILAWHHLRRGNTPGVIGTLMAATMVFTMPMAVWASATLNRHKAPRPLVQKAGALQRQQEIRIGGWQLEYLPSLNFYCQRDVTHHKTEQEAADFLRFPIPVFLFVPEPDWQSLTKIVHCPYRIIGRHHDMYHACNVLVITNR
jgi:4-amino-4-deoxy-L-arabinose transferase-like glycosyltransferase